MIHDHKHLHWNRDRKAECVVCGDVYGEYVPGLTGWFTTQEYDRAKIKFTREATVNQTVSFAPMTVARMEDDNEI